VIVAFGSGPPRLLDELRKYLDRIDTLVYPEFFDAKKFLVNREWSRYAHEVMTSIARGTTVIAVFPDYCYDRCLAVLRPVLDRAVWVYPLHSKNELGWVLTRFDNAVPEWFLGFPNRPELRDFDMEWFLDAAKRYGLRTWLMGLKPRFAKYIRLIDGCDVTTLSIPGWGYRDNREGYRGIPPAAYVAEFMKRLAGERVVLGRHQLRNIFSVKPLTGRG